jgi:Protein ENHANCED DISEASE RESISTANCE 2, C-terminal
VEREVQGQIRVFRAFNVGCQHALSSLSHAHNFLLFVPTCYLQVINSCLNLDEMGMPSMVVSYNAKPVLIRRTGTIFRGDNYIEMDIHVHKFDNMAKGPIHLISSRCGQMFLQIGFVIEGRDDDELPETLFGCVAVNKPQEDSADFLFEND